MAATAVEADTKISNEPKSVTIQVDTMDSGAKKIVVPAAMTGAELISHLIKEGLIGKRVGVMYVVHPCCFSLIIQSEKSPVVLNPGLF